MNGYDRIMGMLRLAELHRMRAEEKRNRGDQAGAAINKRYAEAIDKTMERFMSRKVDEGRM